MQDTKSKASSRITRCAVVPPRYFFFSWTHYFPLKLCKLNSLLRTRGKLIQYLAFMRVLICACILIQAKAAMQGGLRKGNARERSALSKFNNDAVENRREQMTNSSDSSR